MSDFYNSLKSMGSIGDYQKLEAEFQLKKAQAAQQAQMNDIAMQKAQAEAAQPDIEGLASRGLFDYYQGKPLTPEAKAALETQAVLKGSSVQYKPDAAGNVRAVTEPNAYQQFLGGMSAPSAGGDPMAASRAAVTQRQGQIGANPYGTTPQEPVFNDMTVADIENAISPNNPGMRLGGQKPSSDLSQMAFDKQFTPGQPLKTPIQDYRNLMAGVPDAGPNTQQLAQEEAVKIEASKQKTDYENQIKLAAEEFKTGQANSKVALVLDRMNKINEALKQKGAIVSSDSSYAQRMAATAATSDLGQGIRKFNDPEAQALAEEYTSLQSTLLPYYASAAGLGAKSLDSEGERKSILQSFGNPAGIYDANLQQLQTLSSLFGVQSATQDGGGDKEGDTATGPNGQRMIFTKGKWRNL